MPRFISAADVTWAHDLGEQPWDGRALFCGERCPGCLVVATVELNKLNPLTADARELAVLHHIVGLTSGEVPLL